MNSLKDIMESTNIEVRQSKTYKVDDLQLVKEKFIEAFKLVDKTIKNYEHLPEYDQIIEWLNNTEGKGLLMTGSLGRGKSTILFGVIPLLFNAFYRKVMRPVSARKLKDHNINWCACIDDVGQESIINNFGTKTDYVESAVSDCEDHMKLLIMSSNLTKKELTDRYGARAVDRINRLCKIVIFKGESFRKH